MKTALILTTGFVILAAAGASYVLPTAKEKTHTAMYAADMPVAR